MNDVLQRALQKYQNEIIKGNIIIRCDELPEVEGNEQELELMFKNIISIIIDNDLLSNKQFLYVNCTNGSIDAQASNIKDDCKYFEIQFKTNVSAAIIWQRADKYKITECEKIVSKHSGKLKMNIINSTGCLLSIILPGKYS
ncbi:MAG TPA: hypothetical protein VM368_05090 [Flavisolibacter sp.]|nr:hypothetical protein [Flavisolibacter sp.]